ARFEREGSVGAADAIAFGDGGVDEVVRRGLEVDAHFGRDRRFVLLARAAARPEILRTVGEIDEVEMRARISESGFELPLIRERVGRIGKYGDLSVVRQRVVDVVVA